MDTTQILKIQNELAQRTLTEPEARHTRLYRLVCDEGWLRAGLDAVLSNRGSSTPGIEGRTKGVLIPKKRAAPNWSTNFVKNFWPEHTIRPRSNELTFQKQTEN